jgi:hypothetical protein
MQTVRQQTLAWLLAGLAATAASGAMAATNLMVVQDTVTTLTLDLQWDGDTGLVPFNGLNWNAYLAPSFDNGQWSMAVWYAHKDGPHGEGLEHPGHVLPVYQITPGGSALDNGIDDHQGLNPGEVAHANAHLWNIATWTQADTTQGGFTAFQVAHVPEPATWLMLVGGLCVVGAGARRRG